MQFALMIYHAPEEFAMRKNDYSDPHLGAWRAYYKALVEAGVYVGANALEGPENPTAVWWRIFPSTRTTWRALRMPSAKRSFPHSRPGHETACRKTPKPGCSQQHAIHSLMLFVTSAWS